MLQGVSPPSWGSNPKDKWSSHELHEGRSLTHGTARVATCRYKTHSFIHQTLTEVIKFTNNTPEITVFSFVDQLSTTRVLA